MPLYIVCDNLFPDEVAVVSATSETEVYAKVSKLERWFHRDNLSVMAVDGISTEQLAAAFQATLRLLRPDGYRIHGDLDLRAVYEWTRERLEAEINEYWSWIGHPDVDLYHMLRPEDEVDRQVRAERILRFDRWRQWHGELSVPPGVDEFCRNLEAEMRKRAAEQGVDPLRDIEGTRRITESVRSDFAYTEPASVDGDPRASLISRMEQRKANGRPPLLDELTPELMKALYDSGATTRDLERLYGVQEEIRELRDRWQIQPASLPWDKLYESTSLTDREVKALDGVIRLLTWRAQTEHGVALQTGMTATDHQGQLGQTSERWDEVAITLSRLLERFKRLHESSYGT